MDILICKHASITIGVTIIGSIINFIINYPLFLGAFGYNFDVFFKIRHYFAFLALIKLTHFSKLFIKQRRYILYMQQDYNISMTPVSKKEKTEKQNI